MDRYKLREEIARNPDARLRDLVAELLRDDIVALRIRPGSKLNVNQIASALGVSRTPVVEAVGQLSEIGFVTVRPGVSGYYALDLSLPDMISLYKVRSVIESEAITAMADMALSIVSCDAPSAAEADSSRLSAWSRDCWRVSRASEK